MTDTEKIAAAKDQLAEGHGLMSIFLSDSQRRTLQQQLQGEEAAGIADDVLRNAKIIADMPVTYEQDGKGRDAVVHLHYFRGGVDAWVTEKDMDGGVQQAYGYVALHGLGPAGAEPGYISITELVENGLELDLHWTPKTMTEIIGKAA